jgi:hypothetical protein
MEFVNRKFDRVVKASYQEVYNDIQYIFTEVTDFILNYNMKIKCKSNKFNEFNRYMV